MVSVAVAVNVAVGTSVAVGGGLDVEVGGTPVLVFVGDTGVGEDGAGVALDVGGGVALGTVVLVATMVSVGAPGVSPVWITVSVGRGTWVAASGVFR